MAANKNFVDFESFKKSTEEFKTITADDIIKNIIARDELGGTTPDYKAAATSTMFSVSPKGDLEQALQLSSHKRDLENGGVDSKTVDRLLNEIRIGEKPASQIIAENVTSVTSPSPNTKVIGGEVKSPIQETEIIVNKKFDDILKSLDNGDDSYVKAMMNKGIGKVKSSIELG